MQGWKSKTLKKKCRPFEEKVQDFNSEDVRANLVLKNHGTRAGGRGLKGGGLLISQRTNNHCHGGVWRSLPRLNKKWTFRLKKAKIKWKNNSWTELEEILLFGKENAWENLIKFFPLKKLCRKFSNWSLLSIRSLPKKRVGLGGHSRMVRGFFYPRCGGRYVTLQLFNTEQLNEFPRPSFPYLNILSHVSNL